MTMYIHKKVSFKMSKQLREVGSKVKRREPKEEMKILIKVVLGEQRKIG